MIVTPWALVGRRMWVVHLLVAAVVCLAVFALFLDAGGGLVASLGRDPTLTGRTAIWNAVLAMSANPLVGTGFESFWMGDRLDKAQKLIGPGVQEAHNGYLELYLNLGWIGIGLLSVLIVTGYRNVIATLRRDPHTGRLRLAFFVAAITYSFTEAGFRMMSLTWIAFLLAIIAVPKLLARKEEVAPAGTDQARKPLAIEASKPFPRLPTSSRRIDSRHARTEASPARFCQIFAKT